MRLKLSRVIALTALLMAGCRFDAAVADSAVVTCTSADECPPSRTCAVELRVCVVSNGDKDAPTLTSAVMVPQTLGRGSTATLVMVTNEALLRVPQLSLPGFSMISRASTPPGETFVYGYVSPADANEGPAVLTAGLLDLAGNQNSVAVSTLRFDFTPPDVVVGSVKISPELARPGETVLVQVGFTEELGAPPKLTLDNGEVLDALNSSSTLSTFQVHVATDAVDGMLGLSLTRIVDLVGNERVPGVIGSVRIDTDAPRITSVVIVGDLTVRSAQPGFDIFTVVAEGDVGASDTLRSLDVSFLGKLLVCDKPTPNRRECLVTVLSSMPEGDANIQVLATDAAGNSVVKSISIRIDQTAPSLVAGSVSITLLPGPGSRIPVITAMGPGTRVVLGFSVTEALSTDLTLTIGGKPSTCTNSGGLLWSCTYSHVCVPGPDRSASAALTVTDAVGNRFSGPHPSLPTLIADCTGPTAPTASTAGKVVWHRAPFGTSWSVGLAGAQLELMADAVAEAQVTVLVRPGNGENFAAFASGPAGSAVGATTIRADAQTALTHVWVQTVDAAGNASALVPVIENIATAALFGPNATASTPGMVESTAGDDVLLEDATRPWSGNRQVATIGRVWSGTPPQRARGSMVGLGNSKALLFGGIGSEGEVGDSWLFDGLTREWREVGGAPPAGRVAHGLVALQNGSALIFGGQQDGTVLNDSRVFQLTTSLWAAVPGAQPSARYMPEMAVLPRNRVLLFGGYDSTNKPLDDSWIYDGVSNTWSNVSGKSARPPPRIQHQLTALGDGRVLLTGGFGADFFNAIDAYLFDPTTEQWSRITVPPAATAAIDRYGHRAVAFSPTKVLIVGGFGSLSPPPPYLFDSTTSTFTAVTGPQPTNHGRPQLADLGNGTVMVFGGVDGSNAPVPNASLFDGTMLTWSTVAGPQPAPGSDLSMVGMNGGDALVYEEPGGGVDTWLYEASTKRWLQVSSQWGGLYHLTSLNDGRLLHFGAYFRDSTLNDETWVFGGASNAWRNVTAGTRPSARRNAHNTLLTPTKVLLFGGFTTGQVNDTWTFDLNTMLWSQVTGITSPPPARFTQSMTSLANNKVLMIDLISASRVFDAATSQWSAGVGGPARSSAAVAALGTGDALLVGGRDPVGSMAFNEAWLFQISSLTWVQLPAPPFTSANDKAALSLPDGRALVLLDGQSWVFDGATRSWAAGIGAPPDRSLAAQIAGVLGSKVVVTGGQKDTAALNDVWLFDPATLTWSEANQPASVVTTLLGPVPAGAGVAIAQPRTLLGGNMPRYEPYWVVEEKGEAVTAVGSIALSRLGLEPLEVTGLGARATAGADGFSSANASLPGVELQLYGATSSGALFQSCDSIAASSASPAALSCTSTGPLVVRSHAAIRLKPKGASNAKSVGLTVGSAEVDVRYR